MLAFKAVEGRRLIYFTFFKCSNDAEKNWTLEKNGYCIYIIYNSCGTCELTPLGPVLWWSSFCGGIVKMVENQPFTLSDGYVLPSTLCWYCVNICAKGVPKPSMLAWEFSDLWSIVSRKNNNHNNLASINQSTCFFPPKYTTRKRFFHFSFLCLIPVIFFLLLNPNLRLFPQLSRQSFPVSMEKISIKGKINTIQKVCLLLCCAELWSSPTWLKSFKCWGNAFEHQQLSFEARISLIAS